MSLELHVDPFSQWVRSPSHFSHRVIWNCGLFINGRSFKPAEINLEKRGIPIIKITELKYGISDTTGYYNGEFDEKHIINNGEILFAWSGNPTTSIDLFRWHGGKAILNQHIFKVIPDEKVFDFEYFSYILKYMKPTFVELARDQATSMGHVKVSDLKTLVCKYPKKEQQVEVAKHLKVIEEKITVSNQIVHLLKDLGQSIFKDWFIDFGPTKAKINKREQFELNASQAALFPERLVDSELGLIPEGWLIVPLKDICQFEYGKALKEENRIAGTVDVWGSNSVVGTHNIEFLTAPGIVVGRKGNAGAVNWAFKNFWPIDTAFYVVPKNKFSLNFVFGVLQSLDLKNMNSDSAVPGLNREQALSTLIIIPNDFRLIESFTAAHKEIYDLIEIYLDEIKSLLRAQEILLP